LANRFRLFLLRISLPGTTTSDQLAAIWKTILGHSGQPERVRYHWYAGDHDFPPEARKAAVDWFRRWLSRE
jgi:hypothetical protein